MSPRVAHAQSQEKFEVATAEMKAARRTFLDYRQRLKTFDYYHPTPNPLEQQEREALQILYDQAHENLREKEQIQRFMDHELFAKNQKWGRGPEPWRK